MTISSIDVGQDQLTVGMFISSIRGPKSHLFPVHGVYIDNKDQLVTLRNICQVATIDLTRSSDTIYQLWSADSTSLELLDIANTSASYDTGVYLSAPRGGFDSTPDYSLRTVVTDRTKDKYGYQGRLIYRVLNEEVSRISDHDGINLDRLEPLLEDFIRYTKVNPDLLLLESHLSGHSQSLVSIGLRALVHVCRYCYATGKNDAYIQPIGLSLLLFASIASRLPNQMIKLQYSDNADDLALLNNGLNRELGKLEKQCALPLAVKRNINQMQERYDGKGPRGIKGYKLSSGVQLINIVFLFEKAQSTMFSAPPQSALDIIKYLRTTADGSFDERLIHAVLQVLPIYPTGSIISVCHNQLAVVVEQHPFKKLSPKLLSLTDEKGNVLDEPEWISAEQQLGALSQMTALNAQIYEEKIREITEPKRPWYKRLLNPNQIKSWLQSMDLVG